MKSGEDPWRKLEADSGTRFHVEVLRSIRELGEPKWDVQISPYYLDPITSVPREVDLVATSRTPVVDSSWPGALALGRIETRVVLECKYFSSGQPTLLWRADINREEAKGLVRKHGYPKDDRSMSTHHYLQQPRVVKLFATAVGSRKEEHQPIYKAINQVLAAQRGLGVVAQGAGKATWRGGRSAGNAPRVHGWMLPVVVCSSFKDFRALDVESDSELKEVSNHFLMEVDYAYLHHERMVQDYVLIDFVEASYLVKFLEGTLAATIDGLATALAQEWKAFA